MFRGEIVWRFGAVFYTLAGWYKSITFCPDIMRRDHFNLTFPMS